MTDREQYDEVCKELLDLLRTGFGGRSNPALVAKVKASAQEAMRLADNNYVRERARSVVHWVEIACSPRKHAPWGLERVEQFAYEDAYRIRHAFPSPER
ncbi:MAG TPA: hypothetical protein VF727_14595 [Allosphingosinicella sp.]